MVSIPRARARSQTAFTGVIWPVMLIICDEDESRAVTDSLFKRGGDLVEVLRRNRNLNELELEVFAFLSLTQRAEHTRVILGGGENFITGFEIHAHKQG